MAGLDRSGAIPGRDREPGWPSPAPVSGSRRSSAARPTATPALEARQHAASGLSTIAVFLLTSFGEKALPAASQAGMVNNLNDGPCLGHLSLFFARGALSVAAGGVLAALYPAVWMPASS